MATRSPDPPPDTPIILTTERIREYTNACTAGVQPFETAFPRGCPSPDAFHAWAMSVTWAEWRAVIDQTYALQIHQRYYPGWVGVALQEFRTLHGITPSRFCTPTKTGVRLSQNQCTITYSCERWRLFMDEAQVNAKSAITWICARMIWDYLRLPSKSRRTIFHHTTRPAWDV